MSKLNHKLEVNNDQNQNLNSATGDLNCGEQTTHLEGNGYEGQLAKGATNIKRHPTYDFDFNDKENQESVSKISFESRG
jgi:hypothetical protein